MQYCFCFYESAIIFISVYPRAFFSRVSISVRYRSVRTCGHQEVGQLSPRRGSRGAIIIINGSSSSSRSTVTMKAALLYLAQVKAVPLGAWRQSIKQSVTSSCSVNRHVLSPQFFFSSNAFRNIFDQCGISVFSFVFAVCVAHKFRTYVFRHFLL